MARNGLLILTQPLSQLKALIPGVVEQASKAVNDTLYTCVQPSLQNHHITQGSLLHAVTCTKEVQTFVSDFYLKGSSICHTLDIRVLLSHICANSTSCVVEPYMLKKEVSVLLSDSLKIRDVWNSERQSLQDVLTNSFKNINPDLSFHSVKLGSKEESSSNYPESPPSDPLETYPNVVVGGTFDRLHTGHKLLLSESLFRCDKKLTVVITDGEWNKKKTLWELMQPYSEREQGLIDFVSDVKQNITLEPVKIFAPFVNDPDLQCMVVSQETKADGDLVNTERRKKGFNSLEIVTVDLVGDACGCAEEKSKLSSSSLRKRLLGTLIRPIPSRSTVPRTPYRIAVTGSIGSGKSNVCSELEKLGAKIVNCDLLGHKAYVKGTSAHQAIVKEFGDAVVGEDGEINRQKLGPVVFSDKSKLDKLNSIVWPAIRELAEEEIEKHRNAGVNVVALEAAVLLEAGWDDMVHEVWTTFVSHEEAVKRVMERDKLNEGQAEQIISSQISNEARIAKSNVVICPQWAFEDTRQQIEKAWSLLQMRINSSPQNKL